MWSAVRCKHGLKIQFVIKPNEAQIYFLRQQLLPASRPGYNHRVVWPVTAIIIITPVLSTEDWPL